MTISKNVINDLLPLYFSNECSTDTKQLIENYLKSNPDFEKEIKQFSRNPLPNTLPQTLEEEIEMKSLKKTRRLLKMRSYFMGFAIFFSLIPFSFLYTGGEFYWLFREAPTSAFVYAVIGIGFWISYFISNRNINDM
jgi:hypothetical protein